MAVLNFNANDHNPYAGFDPVPAGKYPVVITESEMKETKKGDGQYLQLTMEVTEGEFKGRKLWARLNLDNPNEKAVEIARSELSAICHAVNVLNLRNSEDLHDLPLVVRVSCKAGQDGELRNEIKGYEPKVRTTAASGSAQQKQSERTVPDSKPWGRKS